MSYHSYGGTGGGGSDYYSDPVANVAALPVAGDFTGEVRLVLDVDLFYEWNGSAWQLLAYERTSQKGVANGYASLDASGQVPIAQVPNAAIERLYIVADQAARYALTTNDVQNGDTVKQSDTGEMFYVYDQTQLNGSAGYRVYTAGTASAVAWSGVTGTPTTIAGYGITDTIDQLLSGYSAGAGTVSSSDSIKQAIQKVDANANAKENPLTFSTGLTRATNTVTSNLSTGASGGQSVVGGTGASETLTLSSTAHATKGKITLGNCNWSEVNNTFTVNSTTDTITVDGSTVTSRLKSVSTDGLTETSSLFVKHSATAASGASSIGARSRGSAGSEAIVQSGDHLYRLEGLGFDGTDYAIAGSIHFEVDGTPGSNDMPGRIIFSVTPDGSNTPAEAMRISQDKTVSLSTGTGINEFSIDGTLAGNSDTAVPTEKAVKTYSDTKETKWTLQAKSANFTAADRYTYIVDCSGGAIAIQLPAPVAGLTFKFKDQKGNASANNITLVRNGSENIDNTAATYTFSSDFDAAEIWSDGTSWWIF